MSIADRLKKLVELREKEILTEREFQEEKAKLLSASAPVAKEQDFEAGYGESIEKGFCPKCGDVPVKVSGAGYYPTYSGCFFHLFMSVVTLGFWFSVWLGIIIASHLNKGKKVCLKCGAVLQPC